MKLWKEGDGKIMEAFLKLFGDISISNLILVASSIWFIYMTYQKIQKIIIDNHDKEKARNDQLQKALDAISMYPKYRQQSLAMQEELQKTIDELNQSVQELQEKQNKNDEEKKLREVNRLRDKLLQSYHYYTNIEKNPTQAWSEMEKEAFNNLFKDYENLGGDGYMHGTVQPAMEKLRTIPMHEDTEIASLMRSRK
jgi:DNA repair ATPase RecN